jgi:hypothetical protein
MPMLPPFAPGPGEAVAVLEATGFTQSFAHELALAWVLRNAAPLVSGFSAYVGLDTQPLEVRPIAWARRTAPSGARTASPGSPTGDRRRRPAPVTSALRPGSQSRTQVGAGGASGPLTCPS